MKDKIDAALEKAAEFLVKKQNKEGGWDCDKPSHNQPSVYMTDLVLTSEAVLILNMIKNKNYLENIRKGIFFCMDYELQQNDSVVPWAWKLKVLKKVNTKHANSMAQKVTEAIIKNQKSEGYWPSFPTTSNLDNFYVVMALFNTGNDAAIGKAKKWFESCVAKDKKGWGLDGNAENSETSFTGNAVLALILTGASPESKQLQEARKFLESVQRKSGAWLSTKYTIMEETTYATALLTIALMLLSDKPFNEKIEKGVNFILKAQNSDGSWPHMVGDKKGMIYTTFFSVLLLAFYRYVLENHKETDELVKAPVSTCLLFKQFFKESKKNMAWMTFLGITGSKVLGSTVNAVERRTNILEILSASGSKDVAAMIDELKKQTQYNYLNKKHHITQIKSDLDYLKDIGLVEKIHDLYFICTDFYKL